MIAEVKVCGAVHPEDYRAVCRLVSGHAGRHAASWTINGYSSWSVEDHFASWGEGELKNPHEEEVQFVVVSIPEPHVHKREFLTKIKKPDFHNWWSTYLPWAETFSCLDEAESLIKKLPPEYRDVAEVTKVIFTPRFEHYT